MLSIKKQFKYEATNRLKVKGQKNIYSTNNNHKKTGVKILKSNKVDFITRNITRDKEVYFILIKGKFIEKI